MCCVETKGGAMYCSLIYYKSLSPLLCSVCVLLVYNICVSVSWNMDKLSSLFSLNLAGTKHANKSADEINILIGYFVSCFSSALTFQSSVTSHVHLDFSQTRFTLLHKLFPERFGGEDGRGAWETTIFPKLGVLADPKGVMTDLWCKDSWEKVPKNKLKAHVSCCVESNRNWKSLIKIVPAKSGGWIVLHEHRFTKHEVVCHKTMGLVMDLPGLWHQNLISLRLNDALFF